MRLKWIDFSKAIGIFLVLIGHSRLYGLFDNKLGFIIYSFHMPLFFIINGYLFKPLDMKRFLRKSFNSYLIPWFLTTIIINLISILLLKDFSLIKTMISSFLLLKSNISFLWFLECLFIGSNLFNIILKCSKDIKLVGSLSVLLSMIGYFMSIKGLNNFYFYSALYCQIFYFFGYYLNKRENKFDNLKPNIFLCIFLFFTLVVLSIYKGNTSYDISNAIFGSNYICGITRGLFGSLIIFFISKVITKFINTNIMNYIGQHSLNFYILTCWLPQLYSYILEFFSINSSFCTYFRWPFVIIGSMTINYLILKIKNKLNC